MLFNIPYNSIRRRVSIAQLQRLQVLLPVSGIGYLYSKIGIPGRRDAELHGSFDCLCDNTAKKESWTNRKKKKKDWWIFMPIMLTLNNHEL